MNSRNAAPLALLALAACWATPVAIETRPVAPQVPGEPQRPDVDPTTGRTDWNHVTVVLTPDDELHEPAISLQPTLRQSLPGGATAVVRAGPDAGSGTALLRLVLPVGEESGSKAALALLAAHCAIDVPATARSRPSVQATVEALGGEVRIRVGSRATCFDITCPTGAWPGALSSLAGALADPPSGKDQIERTRTALAQQLRRELARPVLSNMVRLVTTAEGRMPQDLLTALENRIPEEVGLFQRLAFRPAGAVLALWTPDGDPAQLVQSARDAMASWTGTEMLATAPPAPPAPAMGSGVYWAPSDAETSRVALVLAVPELSEPAAIERLVLQECLTLRGVGGRLGEAVSGMAPFALALQADDHWNGVSRYLVLRSAALPRQVLPLWEAQVLARASLLRDPPSAEVVALAAARVRLRLLAEYADPFAWLESASAQALRGAEPVDLQAAIGKLERPRQLDLGKAADDLAAARIAMVVIGGKPLPNEKVQVNGVPRAFLREPSAEVPLEVDEQIRAATPYLDSAVAALGGNGKLAALGGLSATMTRTSTDGAVAEEKLWYLAPDRCRRLRRVLATSIETIVGRDRRIERASGEQVQLDPDDARNLLDETTRYPLLLLAERARGKTRYRLVSLRASGDREVAVVERIAPGQPQLRLFIDTESGLVRRVETREWRPELQASIQVVEEWSDYRPVAGLRAPFFCRVTFDETDASTVRWESLDLTPPAPNEVQ